jgi:ADP-heptose:LPS heptosyltransferase
MKVLIIKNDGFGDLIISLPILSNIYYKNQKNLKLDIVLSEINSDLRFSLQNFNNIFFLKNLGTKFNPNKKISMNDMANLRKIKNTKYDVCFVMRRSLNYENLKVMQFVNAKKKYTCIENTSKNKNLLNILKKTTVDWININQNNNINEYNYYSYFIKKIGFKIKEKLLKIKNLKKSDIKRIIINLSGEKQITIASNLSKLVDLVLNNSNSKIIIIGKTFDNELSKNFKKILRNYKRNKRILNLFSKTNFHQSMKLIDESSIYIGFETGLSHYAVNKGIKSLIIVASGGGHKWFPYPREIKKNETYWTYNTPCADCDYIGNKQCIFQTRFCVDNIFKNNLEEKFKNFLNTKNDFINFSSYTHFLSNWRYKSKRSNIYKISNKNKIEIKIDIISKIKYLLETFRFILTNKLIFFFLKKTLSKIF